MNTTLLAAAGDLHPWVLWQLEWKWFPSKTSTSW